MTRITQTIAGILLATLAVLSLAGLIAAVRILLSVVIM